MSTQTETIPANIRRVLVVDGNAAEREILVRALERFRLPVRACAGAEEALIEIFRADAGDAYGLVLTDLRMPDMSGLELAKAIAHAGLVHVPKVILVTADDCGNVQLQAENASIAGVLFRPIEYALLQGALADMLTKDSGRRVTVSMPDSQAAPPSAADKLPISIPGFDLADTLNRFGNDVPLYHHILKLLVPTLTDALAHFDHALANHDRTKIKSSAHAIRGMASNVGAAALAAYGEKLENALCNDEDVSCDLPAFRALIEETLQAVERGFLAQTARRI